MKPGNIKIQDLTPMGLADAIKLVAHDETSLLIDGKADRLVNAAGDGDRSASQPSTFARMLAQCLYGRGARVDAHFEKGDPRLGNRRLQQGRSGGSVETRTVRRVG